jgi:hypothetical protein
MVDVIPPVCLGTVRPHSPIGLSHIYCRSCATTRHHIKYYSYFINYIVYSDSIEANLDNLKLFSNCDVWTFSFFFAFRALVPPLALGAGMSPCSICYCCDSTIAVSFFTRLEHRGSSPSSEALGESLLDKI